MKKIVLFSILTFLVPSFLLAGDGEFAVYRIPPALLKNANAIMRLEETSFKIYNTKETVLRKHYVITILNEKADEFAVFSQAYNKVYSITDIEGRLYDAMGKELKKIKKKDLQDFSGVDDNSLIDDTRYKHHNFYYKAYPYTIEYFYELNFKTTFFFPSWVPQDEEGLAVERSTLVVEHPMDYQLRYKAFNYKEDPVTLNENKNRSLSWSVKNVPAIWRENFSPAWHEMTTMILLGPTDFQFEDYKGNMVSWQDFGKFIYSLKQGRDQLPEKVKQDIHSIAANTTDPKEKVSRLYEYMQKNTRYISIQLGIGGWQPFDASEVGKKGYGDCKALSNYMYSILKEEGIASYYTLVNSGKGQHYLTTDFPSQQFNHVILCVPLNKDTIWLECTSQILQAGYLGSHTCDRPVLLVDETGGKLVNTPCYKLKDNLQVRNIKASLETDGTLKIEASSYYSGLQQDHYQGMISYLSNEKVKEALHEELDFATYDVNSFKYTQEKNSLPAIKESLNITVSNYATITGKRLFIIPNVMTRSHRKLSSDSARKYEIQLGMEYKDVDSVEIELPAGYTTESIPQPVTVQSKFGNYSSSVKLNENKLIYYRSIEQFGGRYPASAYADLVKFYEMIYKADWNKVVLVKN